jgi:hypothetical protein
MNQARLERKLIAAARLRPPSDAVPLAFEQRMMARLRSDPARDAWLDWSRALWRATAPCVAVAVLIGIWTALSPAPNTSSTDFSQALENTLFVSVTQDGSSTW